MVLLSALGHACGAPAAGGGAGAPPVALGGTVGAGQSSYTCPAGALVVGASDDAAGLINAAPAGSTICVSGSHALSSPIAPKANQKLIGIGAGAGLKGSVVLTGWKPGGPGIWFYDGDAARTPGLPHLLAEFSDNAFSCYEVATYQDDVFFDDSRMMRVLELRQLGTGASLPPGQAVTAGEVGRFYFDYSAQRVYVDRDPTGHVVELAVLDAVMQAKYGVDHVELSNLVLEKARTAILNLSPGTAGSGKSWKITDCTIRFAHNFGVKGGAGTNATDQMTYVRTLITNNGQFGISSGGSWQTLQDTELSWNNIANYRLASDTGCGGYWGAGAVKFVLTLGDPTTPGLQVVNVDSHHNVGDGFWTDIHNRYVKVSGGRFHDNEGNGYFHEISCDIEISGAEFDHNGQALKNADLGSRGVGIVVSDSNNANIHHNSVHDNQRGIVLQFQPQHTGMLAAQPEKQCPPANADGDTSQSLTNDDVHDNAIFMCAGSSGGNAGPTLASRQNTFSGNRYHLPDAAGNWFLDGRPMSWAQWTSAGHDTTGSQQTPCTYP